MNCPQLWSEISLYMGREWTRKMIARAKQAPLDIYSGNEAGNLLALVVPGHFSHTKSLNISDVDLNVVHSLTAAAPILERLTLYSTMADGNPVLSLPEDIFAFHASRLRIASFNGFKVPWSSLILRNVLQLKIAIPRQAFPSLPSQREVFDALANMPYLESLIVYFALPSFAHGAVEPQRRGSIALPHLWKLSLAGPLWDIVAFLEVIQSPALTIVLDRGFFIEANPDDPLNGADPLQSFRDINSRGMGSYWFYSCKSRGSVF